jgi:hypothetical protein
MENIHLDDGLIGPNELLKRIDMDGKKTWLYQKTHRKEIPFYKIGKHLRFSWLEIKDSLAKQ